MLCFLRLVSDSSLVLIYPKTRESTLEHIFVCSKTFWNICLKFRIVQRGQAHVWRKWPVYASYLLDRPNRLDVILNHSFCPFINERLEYYTSQSKLVSQYRMDSLCGTSWNKVWPIPWCQPHNHVICYNVPETIKTVQHSEWRKITQSIDKYVLVLPNHKQVLRTTAKSSKLTFGKQV